jgi:hypothetical protein
MGPRGALLILALLACARGAPPTVASSPSHVDSRPPCRVGDPAACATGRVCVNITPNHAECRPVAAEAPVGVLALPVDAATEVYCTHASGEGSHAWENALWALDLDSAYDGPPATIRASAEGIAYVFPRDETCVAPPGTPARSDDQPCGEGWGNHVKVFHGAGYFTLYAHLARVAVRDGQRVTRGEALGTEGSTGMAGHRHVHWSVQRLPGSSEAEWSQRRAWIGESVPFRFEVTAAGQRATLAVRDVRCPHSSAGALPPDVQPRWRGVAP